VVDDLFGALQRALADIEVTSDDPRELLATPVRAFVRFAAEHPELNRIMMQESTSDSERLEWVVETHVRPVHRAMTSVWSLLADAGLVAPVDGTIAYYLLVGAASFIYVASPSLRRPHGPGADARSRRGPRRRGGHDAYWPPDTPTRRVTVTVRRELLTRPLGHAPGSVP
jgi:hypothetical protein